MLDEMISTHDSWNLLQQPAHPGQGIHAAFRALLSAIDQGWQVEGITFKASPLRIGVGYYVFVLHGADLDLRCQFMVPIAPEVEDFIQNNGYAVR